MLLGTALVQVQDTVGSCRTVRALIDSASQINAITSNCCDRLGLKPSRWTVLVTGLSGQNVPDVHGVVQSMLVSLVSSMEDLMKRFWSVEEPEAASQQFTENGLCEELFHSEVSRDSQGQFSVALPFRSGQPVKSFSGSRQVALNRFLHLERKLTADNILYIASSCPSMRNSVI